MRRAVKRAAELVLTRSGMAAAGRLLHRRAPLILAYHNVVPDDAAPCGERALHVRRSDFARHLDILGQHREVVPLAELWTDEGAGPPRAAVTFDDAYLGAVTLGVEEVVKRGMAATIFACPGLLGGTAFWWDQLAGGFGGAIPVGIRERALRELGGRQQDVLEWAEGEGMSLDEVGPHGRSATLQELRRATSLPRIDVASHTWSHPNLTALDADELEAELERPTAWLERTLDRPVPWVSYPFGLECETVRSMARSHYGAGLRVDGGFAPRQAPDPGSDARFCLPRLNIPAGLSFDNFELRISGIV